MLTWNIRFYNKNAVVLLWRNVWHSCCWASVLQHCALVKLAHWKVERAINCPYCSSFFKWLIPVKSWTGTNCHCVNLQNGRGVGGGGDTKGVLCFCSCRRFSRWIKSRVWSWKLCLRSSKILQEEGSLYAKKVVMKKFSLANFVILVRLACWKLQTRTLICITASFEIVGFYKSKNHRVTL